MRFRTLEAIQQLIELRIAENTTLEYKSQLPLSTENDRKELLKDFTGMGNGGGGTLILGMDEEKDTSVARRLTPLPDLSVIGQIEDIVISTVRPPLIWSHNAYAFEGGWIVVVDVEQSTLGPYMIDAYGEQRFHRRSNKSVHRMSEQEVRDGYSIALRSRDRREQVWKDHHLPLRIANGATCLVVSALPEEPLSEIINSREIDLRSFAPPEGIAHYVNLTRLSMVPFSLKHWADGLTAEIAKIESSEWLTLRIHRDGAVGIAQEVLTGIAYESISRTLNAFLLYLAWFWNEFSMQRPVELEVAIVGLPLAALQDDVFSSARQKIVEPPGLTVGHVGITVNELPWELSRAAVRHRIVRRFADRLKQAFGEPGATSMFEHGWLYNNAGRRLNLALDQGKIWDPGQGGSIANIGTDGQIWGTNGKVCTFVIDGVIVDTEGRTLATLEMANGIGCPDDFLPRIDQYSDSPRALGTVRVETPLTQELPAPTGLWSDLDLRSLIEL
jgi:hypothetical protein